MVVIMLLNFLVGLTDVYVAGLIGPDVQAAVGFVGQLYFLVIIIANALSIGTVAMAARAFGARDERRALHVARQSLIFSLIVASGLTLVGYLFSAEIIAAAGFPDTIREIGEDFLRIFVLALGPNYILIVSNAVFRASGEVKRILLTMVLVSVLNVAAVFALVFGLFSFPGLGYRGIALATALSVAAGMVVNLCQFTTGRWRSIYAAEHGLSLQTIRQIVSLGWPAALLQIAWNAGSIVLYTILSRLGDTSITALASITNGLRLEAVIYLPAFAMNMASSVLIGQNLGAGKPDRAERLGWKVATAGVLVVSTMALPVFVWAEEFAGLVARSPGVIAETARYLRINMLSEPFMALSAILGGCLQGAGDTRGAMWVIAVAMWLVRLPLAYVLALTLGYGAAGVWVAMVISMCVQGLLMAFRFRRGRWKELSLR
jgi:putative MATE family efflux protein